MLDIHPQPDYARLGGHVGGSTTPVGRLDESAFIQDVLAARKAMASVVDAGYFAAQEEEPFQILYHFDSVDACQPLVAEDDWGELPADVEARAQALMDGRDSEFLMEEPIRALRLRWRP